MHPKRRDLSRGRLGRAIHKFTAARFNDGLRESVVAVCSILSINPDSVLQIVLQQDDARRDYQSSYKASIYGKGKRRDAKKRRKTRDAADSSQGTYAANQGLNDDFDVGSEGDEDAVEFGSRAASGNQPRQRRPQRCSACGQVGHRRDRCPNAAPERAGGEAGPSSEPVECDPESDPESDEDEAEDPMERPDDAVCAYCDVSNVFVVPCGHCDAWVHRECAFAAFPELYPDEAFYDMSVDVQCEVCSTVPEAE